EFEALSYRWGEDVFPEQLFIGTQSLNITENLYPALQHIRSAVRPRCLWVDAVCIN
ncbi:hypothetical protein K432DRAFT_292865, partial [Lepidopterella palustris CBS 459.81]